MIKKLIFLATFVASILFFSTVVGANEQKQNDIYWKIGDAIRSIIVCKTEKDIFDYKGLEFVYNKVFTKKYNLEGHILEKELIQKFEKKFININKLI